MLPSQARSLLQARQDWDGAGWKQATQAQRALSPQWGRDHREATRLHLPLLRHPVSPWLRTQPPRKLRTCKIKIQYSVGP